MEMTLPNDFQAKISVPPGTELVLQRDADGVYIFGTKASVQAEQIKKFEEYEKKLKPNPKYTGEYVADIVRRYRRGEY